MYEFCRRYLGILILILFLAISCSDGGSSGDDSGDSGDPAASAGADDVVINGKVLTQEQEDEVFRIFGEIPAPGNYWYDPVSGLAGEVGDIASAFLPPNLPFAPIKQNASGGNTGVVVNGREITSVELDFLEQLFQVVVPAGDYTLLSNGYIHPVDDYYSGGNISDALGASNQTDNFWSTAYGTGNSSGGCSYVSIPSATGGTSTTVTSGCG